MNIKILMSTMNKKDIEELKLNEKNISNCIIINQTKEQIKNIEKGDVVFYSYNEKGLAKSRNRLLEKIESDVDIGIITDDDVTFVKEYKDIVQKAYDTIKNADIIIFKSLDENGKDRRKYPSHNKELTRKEILQVCSIEITFRVLKIKDKVRFDERFGLGSRYKSGEENIFLLDCYNKGLKIYFYNEAINIHPKESTGAIWMEEDIYEKGALFRRLYPKMCFFMVLPIAILKRNICKTNIFNITKLLFKGIKEIKIREIHVVEKDEHLMEKEEKEDEITYYVDFDLIYNENNEGITYNDGGDTRNFYLKKVKGEWKIISIGLL